MKTFCICHSLGCPEARPAYQKPAGFYARRTEGSTSWLVPGSGLGSWFSPNMSWISVIVGSHPLDQAAVKEGSFTLAQTQRKRKKGGAARRHTLPGPALRGLPLASTHPVTSSTFDGPPPQPTSEHLQLLGVQSPFKLLDVICVHA